GARHPAGGDPGGECRPRTRHRTFENAARPTRSNQRMNEIHGGGARSDALVLFGVTGDLAHKKIFPALYAMAKRGTLEVPVVGVASSDWTDAQLRKRAEEAIGAAGKVGDRAALRRVLSALRYVQGNYNDLSTFTKLKAALGSA